MRTITTLALGIAFVTAGHAQLEIRPHVGMNMRNLTEAPDRHEWRSRAGYQLGADLLLGRKLYMAFGAQYMHNSTELVPPAGTSGLLNTGALRVPVRLGYRFVHPDEEPTVNFRLFGGFVANFPVSTSYDQDGVEKPEFGTANFGLTAGAGLDIWILFIEAGYDVGLTTVFDDNTWQVDPRANMLQVNAGVRLKFAQ